MWRNPGNISGKLSGCLRRSVSTKLLTNRHEVVKADRESIPLLASIDKKLQSGKQYNYFLTDKDVHFLQHTIPEAIRSREGQVMPVQERRMFEQAEHLDRLISLSNANARGQMLWKIQQVISMLGRKEADTGSPEVQGIIFD